MERTGTTPSRADLAAKVASDQLFALDATSARKRWHYRGGLIFNPTITILEDRVYFVETRDRKVIDGEARRLVDDNGWKDLRLVALDLNSGRKAWSKKIAPTPGLTAFYLAAGEKRLVMTTSAAGKIQVNCRSAKNGKEEWQSEFGWEADHHGKHLSRPAISDGKLIIRPAVFDLKTGEPLPLRFPVGHTCSSYTLTSKSIFMRAGNITMWSPERESITHWNRLRPDCWVSTIPALGMLLSPGRRRRMQLR